MKAKLESLDEVDPEILATFDKLGIPLNEQKRLSNVAVDAVFDSVSIATTFREDLAKAGVIFCSISEAIKEYPDLIKKYMGSVVPVADNFYTALNAAVFSDGSFCYIPKGVTSPMELSTYFRINAQETGQFERTLIVAEEDSYVSYLEGCTAPAYDTNQVPPASIMYFPHLHIDAAIRNPVLPCFGPTRPWRVSHFVGERQRPATIAESTDCAG
jgi:Fe-S cluster assembly protein SufB